MTEAEDLPLVRSRGMLTRQISAVITGVVILVGTLSWGLMTYRQHTDSHRELVSALQDARVTHPWPCVWMFEQRHGHLRRTPASPASLPVHADLERVSRRRPVLVTGHRVGGVDYLVRTEWHGDLVAQAALDLRYQAEERGRLYLAVAVAEAVGLAAAVTTGRLLAGHAIRPLGEALRRQRRFVADASHELRTPLTQIHTRAQLLERRLRAGADPASLADDAHRLVANSRTFGELLDDMLHAAQSGAGGPRCNPVDLRALVAEVAGAEAPRLRQRGVSLDVAAGTGPYLVGGSGPALRRVINALVDNAIGHTRSGGHIRLSLRLVDKGRTVLFTVADDGAGFGEGEAERIFERFVHGDQGTGRRFGLGLALAREVLAGYGGSITAAGEPGRGATFTVRLPTNTSPAATPGGAAAQTSSARGA